jgi:hypothetical protein
MKSPLRGITSVRRRFRIPSLFRRPCFAV